MRSLLVAALLGGLGAGLACDPKGDDCSAGSEGCPCQENDVCSQGLACFSGHCVDPNWTPDDDGNADDGDGEDDDDDGGGGGGDNVSACEAWVESYECGDYDIGQSVDCSLYANTPCDVSGYFDCLTDNTGCNDGVPDTSGWSMCADELDCGADSAADDGDGDDDGGGDGGGVDNVSACENWVENAECGDYDWSQSVDCSLYANTPCDIADYFNCLTENTKCVDGIPDTAGWSTCVDLAQCG